jgi:hypothetical protein
LEYWEKEVIFIFLEIQYFFRRRAVLLAFKLSNSCKDLFKLKALKGFKRILGIPGTLGTFFYCEGRYIYENQRIFQDS